MICDELFFTGDFRFAPEKTDQSEEQVASIVANTIKEIARYANITDENRIHLVAGNHDLKRGDKGTQRVFNITALKTHYIDMLEGNVGDASIGDDIIAQLTSAFGFFKKVIYALFSESRANNLWSKFANEAHYMDSSPHSDVGILCLNTALVSNYDGERHRLVVDHTRVRTIISQFCDNTNREKPILVLAHHPLDHLDYNETEQLRHYFARYNVCAYLSGHEHRCYSTVKDRVLLEAISGSVRAQHGAQVGFLSGEYNPEQRVFTITNSHLWDNKNWIPSSSFYEIKGIGDRITFYPEGHPERRFIESSEKSRLNSNFPLSRIENESYNLNTYENRDDLIRSLNTMKKERAVKFLISGPTENNNLGGKVAPDVFYRDFYVRHDFEAEEKLGAQLEELFTDPEHNVCLLLGDAGTGKSTFLRTMTLRAQSDALPTNALLYRYFLFDCAVKATTKGESPFFPAHDLYKKTRTEYKRMKVAAENGGVIWRDTYIRLLKGIYENKSHFDKDETLDLAEAAKYIDKRLSNYEYRTTVDTEYIFRNSSSHSVNMILYCLLLASKNTLFDSDIQRKYIIVFDNVEAYTTAEQLEIGRFFSSLYDTLSSFFAKVEELGIRPKEMLPIDFMTDFTFIISARPTTILEPDNMEPVHNKTGLYSKYVFNRKFYDFTIDALLIKLKFLYDNCRSSAMFDECIKIAGLLVPRDTIEKYLSNNMLVEDNDLKMYISQKYLPFFNNNYRNAILSLNSLYAKEALGGSWMSHVLKLSSRSMNVLDNIRINSARQIILRNSLETFNSQGYLDQMGIGNISGDKSYSLARLLMAFIAFCENRRDGWNYDGSDEITIRKIVEFMFPVYKHEDVLLAIFRLSKWTKSEIFIENIDSKKRGTMVSDWAIFLDIDCNQTQFERLITSYGSPSYNALLDTHIKLTPAGKCFNDYVSRQFEYFAARFETPALPLPLCIADTSLLDDAVCQIDRVFKAVEDFVLGIANSFELDSMSDQIQQKVHASLRARVFSTVIIEHIDYIDRCRQLALAQKYGDETKREMNRKMLSLIGQYFALLKRGYYVLAKYNSNIRCDYHGYDISVSYGIVEDILQELKNTLDATLSIYDACKVKSQVRSLIS